MSIHDLLYSNIHCFIAWSIHKLEQVLHGSYLKVLGVSAHATLAGRALNVDVLIHALHMADSGIDAGGDCVNLHGDGIQTTIQCRETLTCPVLVVPDDTDGRNCSTLCFCESGMDVSYLSISDMKG